MTNRLHVNQTVRNFGILAKIAGFHEITGDPILRPLWNDGSRWLADADKCEPVECEPPKVLCYKRGIVTLG